MYTILRTALGTKIDISTSRPVPRVPPVLLDPLLPRRVGAPPSLPPLELQLLAPKVQLFGSRRKHRGPPPLSPLIRGGRGPPQILVSYIQLRIRPPYESGAGTIFCTIPLEILGYGISSEMSSFRPMLPTDPSGASAAHARV